MSILKIFQLVLGLASSLSRYMERRELIEAGAAREQRDQLTEMWNHVEDIRSAQRIISADTRKRLREKFKGD